MASCSWMQSAAGECTPGVVVAAGRAEKTMQSRTTSVVAVTSFPGLARRGGCAPA